MMPIKTLKIWCASIVLLGVGLVFLSLIFGLHSVSASTQFGILGQEAPELELNSWIDGNGKPMDPVKLKDYRGKVVYLYFFQDW